MNPTSAPPSRRGVVAYWPSADSYARSHVRATHLDIAKGLATLKGYEAAGKFKPSLLSAGPVYVLPGDTLLVTEAEALGVRDEHDLFGGVVPHPVVATKAITHPLVGPDAVAPAGWSADFGRRIEGFVLAGFSAFSRADAHRAGLRLLERGPVRVKSVRETGGRGQEVVSDAIQLEALLDGMDAAELSRWGLVLEEHLDAVTTYSVGLVRVADLVASYTGTQCLTPDNQGAPVYGGSALTVVQGGFDAVLGLDLAEDVRRAVVQACAYDDAVTEAFPGVIASRRNYDVVHGLDAHGRPRTGVLEQSWRVGGASRIGGPCTRRASRSMVRAKRRHRTPPCHSGASTSGSASSPSTQWWRPMATRDETIDIAVDDQNIAGTLVAPVSAIPGFLFVHGWSGSQEQYLARAREVAALGCVCLTFDLRGHARTDAQFETVTREDNLRDVIAAYDVLARHPSVDPAAIAVVGSSYGGYLAAILSSLRPMRWLALRVPALYKDEDWAVPKRRLDREELATYRRGTFRAAENRALRACAAFQGDVLIVESEHDDIVPHPVITNYRTAF